MQTRVAFNAGEFSPDLACRTDLDYYARGCSRLENWQVLQTGGVRRRRGMRLFAKADNREVHLMPYIYSFAAVADVRFLVEVGRSLIRVLNPETGLIVARFESGNVAEDESEVLDFEYQNPRACRYFQINKLLFITSQECRPMVLKYDGKKWELNAWKFKHAPFRYNHDARDYPISLRVGADEIEVDFSEVTDEAERPEAIVKRDVLQAAFYLEQQELTASSKSLRDGVQVVRGVPDSCKAGDKFAVWEDADETKFYVCTAAWSTSQYVAGLESPANYTQNFLETLGDGDWDDVTPVYSVRDAAVNGSIAKGTKVAIRSAYWKYFYCFRDFERPVDGGTDFDDYRDFFWAGLPVGDAATCMSGWSFFCSGVWYAKYEVLRNYDTAAVNGDWEPRGVSFSRNFATQNLQVSGEEKEEECYLRLRLCKTRCMADPTENEDGTLSADLAAGFPADSCCNRLIVNTYKHNVLLRCTRASEMLVWEDASPVPLLQPFSKQVYDWSWAAFSERYGYPALVYLFNSRLVFAATPEQPQTLWLSCTDDLDNFMTGTLDSSSIWATFSTCSQDPIYWMAEQNHQLVCGTSAEICALTNPAKTFLTPANALRVHLSDSGCGSSPALVAENKVVFVGRGSWRVYQFAYSLEADGLVSSELSLFAAHIGEEHGGFGSCAMTTKPDVVCYYVMGDGSVALCTYNPMQDVKAWHRWNTHGTVLDVCVLPDGDRRDRVFFLVERKGKVFIEVVDDDSPLSDNGGNDYESVLVTNALGNPLRELAQKQNGGRVFMRLIAPCVYRNNVWVSKDAFRTEYLLDRQQPLTLTATWHELVAPTDYAFDVTAGIKVTGDCDFSLAAIQA